MRIKYLFLSLWLMGSLWGQENLLKSPKSSKSAVQDYAGALSSSQSQQLNQMLTRYADSTSTGIVVVIVNEVEDDINYRAAELLTQWGVGQKGKDNGVLILLAYRQRKVAISTGYGVEHRLTDALSRRIIQTKMIPHFKENDYYGGLVSGTEAIMEVLKGEFKGEVNSNSSSFFEKILIISLLIFFIILRIRGGGGGGLRTLSSGGVYWGNFGSSAGSGGFGGFGGGRGGGGGASGSW